MGNHSVWVGRVDTSMDSRDSCGRNQSSSMSIANTSDNTTGSNLSMGNLSNSVGFSLPLAIGMDTIRIARVDTGNIGIARVDTGNMGIARVDTRDMGDSGVCEGNSTNCFDTSLNSIGDHANIASTTISQCIQDWQTSSNLSNSVGLGIP